MLEHINPKNIIFIDIETAPVVKDFEQLNDRMKKAWEKKSSFFREDSNPEDVWMKSAVYSEFSRIICISAAVIYTENKSRKIRVKAFYNEDEKVLLEEFGKMLAGYKRKKDYLLCAHNGKEFDFPFIARRMLINRVNIPDVLDIAGLKPWEVNLLDTMNLWKFGDYKHYTPLELLATLFEIPTPKNEIDGSMVPSLYWQENKLNDIVNYCNKDVVTVANILLSYKGEKIITDENIEISN